jgi:putative transposase
MAWTKHTRAAVGDLGLGARLSDTQYALFAQYLPAARPGGRRRTTDLRLVLDGVLHVLRTGCQWRFLPADFPPWQTTYSYFRDWTKAGVWQIALTALREQARQAAGHDAQPSATIIDSQSVKTTEKGGCAVTMPARRSMAESGISWSTHSAS